MYKVTYRFKAHPKICFYAYFYDDPTYAEIEDTLLGRYSVSLDLWHYSVTSNV